MELLEKWNQMDRLLHIWGGALLRWVWATSPFMLITGYQGIIDLLAIKTRPDFAQ